MMEYGSLGEDEGVNLSELISSVERDIWILEQLENQSRRRDPSALELPVVTTEEILKLPGYKPHRGHPTSRAPAAPPIVDSFVCQDESPPTLPPKRRTASESDDDNHHPRFLPRRNGVTNVLYARRLPSPPIAPRVSSRRTEDDDDDYKKLFCPLCAQSFGYVFGLECHLLSVHYEDLQLLKEEYVDVETEEFKPGFCPQCRAQFLKPGLVVKHLVYHHPDFVTKIVNSAKSSSSDWSCRFCEQKFLQRHLRLFMIHLEQRHVRELELVIRSKQDDKNIYESLLEHSNLYRKRSGSLSNPRDNSPFYYEIQDRGRTSKVTSSSFSFRTASKYNNNNNNNNNNNTPPLIVKAKQTFKKEKGAPSKRLFDEPFTVKRLYKCNLCEAAFVENAFLLMHLKSKHRSTVVKALKPQYSCGSCPAKFFKNSFLVKHCESHQNERSQYDRVR